LAFWLKDFYRFADMQDVETRGGAPVTLKSRNYNTQGLSGWSRFIITTTLTYILMAGATGVVVFNSPTISAILAWWVIAHLSSRVWDVMDRTPHLDRIMQWTRQNQVGEYGVRLVKSGYRRLGVKALINKGDKLLGSMETLSDYFSKSKIDHNSLVMTLAHDDIQDKQMLPSKLKEFGLNIKNPSGLMSFLNNAQQFLNKTSVANIKNKRFASELKQLGVSINSKDDNSSELFSLYTGLRFDQSSNRDKGFYLIDMLKAGVPPRQASKVAFMLNHQSDIAELMSAKSSLEEKRNFILELASLAGKNGIESVELQQLLDTMIASRLSEQIANVGDIQYQEKLIQETLQLRRQLVQSGDIKNIFKNKTSLALYLYRQKHFAEAEQLAYQQVNQDQADQRTYQILFSSMLAQEKNRLMGPLLKQAISDFPNNVRFKKQYANWKRLFEKDSINTSEFNDTPVVPGLAPA
jgi:hypothetical protein